MNSEKKIHHGSIMHGLIHTFSDDLKKIFCSISVHVALVSGF